MKQFLTFLLFIIYQLHVFGQQDPINAQYMFNGMVINPAFAGNSDKLNFNYLNRRQLTNLTITPIVQNFSINAPFNYQRIGLGLYVVNEQYFIQNNTSINAVYAYKINFVNGTLAFGISGGLIQSKLDFSSLTIKDNQDLKNNSPNIIMPDLGTGLLYSDKKKYLGLSIQHMIPGSGDVGFKNSIYYSQTAHFYLIGGYRIHVSEYLQLVPSFLIRYTNKNLTIADFTIHTKYKNNYWIGFSARTSETISFQAGVNFNELLHLNQNLKLGYAYDWGFGSNLKQIGNSHEIMLILDLEFHPSPEKIKKKIVKSNPVFF
ncbi:MAG: PorP/SprF family type IX secretion system membrane protein [Bacteroidota bacterium]|nr:PorP/SprF family type IX secretion system membrane protein [Bacteroidota bacterium]